MSSFCWGCLHWFDVRPLAEYNCRSSWSRLGGVYIFVKQWDQYLQPIYIGSTKSFKARLPYHEEWFNSQRYGATHIHTRVETQPDVRRNLEQFLIAALRPRLNTHYRCWKVSEADRSFILSTSFAVP